MCILKPCTSRYTFWLHFEQISEKFKTTRAQHWKMYRFDWKSKKKWGKSASHPDNIYNRMDLFCGESIVRNRVGSLSLARNCFLLFIRFARIARLSHVLAPGQERTWNLVFCSFVRSVYLNIASFHFRSIRSNLSTQNVQFQT